MCIRDSHQPRFYAAPNFLKMGIKYLNLSFFWTISTIKDEKSAVKFHYIKTLSGKVVAQSIAFRVVSIILAGDSSVPLISERKGTDPHWKHLHCTHFASQRGSCDVIASLACVRLTGWPVAWNWRRAVLSADAGLLVDTATDTVTDLVNTKRKVTYCTMLHSSLSKVLSDHLDSKE